MTLARFAAFPLLLTLAFSPVLAAVDPDTVVTQEDRKFSTAEVTISKGQAVTFVNHDRVRHNISMRTPIGDEQTSTVQTPGQTNVIAFDRSGTYRVYCLIHPMMHLAVNVQ